MPALTSGRSRSFRSVVAVVSTALLVAGGLLLGASPASAHDELVSTDPAADAAVAELPAVLTLTFSGELLGDAGATEVQVTDASGTSLVAGAPVVQTNVVTQPLTPGASGAVAVLWRVVSSDGHPISGEYSFSVAAAPAPSPTPTSTPTAHTTPTVSPSPSTASATPTPTIGLVPADEGSAPLPWILFAVIGVAVLGGVVYLLVSRARRARELEEARMAGVPTPADSTPPDPSAPGSDTPADR